MEAKANRLCDTAIKAGEGLVRAAALSQTIRSYSVHIVEFPALRKELSGENGGGPTPIRNTLDLVLAANQKRGNLRAQFLDHGGKRGKFWNQRTEPLLPGFLDVVEHRFGKEILRARE